MGGGGWRRQWEELGSHDYHSDHPLSKTEKKSKSVRERTLYFILAQSILVYVAYKC